ncbi:MAG: hypothetical protein HQK83_04200 [Fibrobacteria bacterium]|nr:hypothetical protein [Fibrobacteria bacterium]
MKTSLKHILLVLITCTVVLADDSTLVSNDSLIKSGINTFQNGYNAWSISVFQKSISLFSKAADLNNRDFRPYYWSGVVQFHISNYYLFGEKKSRNKKQGVKAVNAALEALEKSLELQPEHGESLALYGTITGIKIYLKLYLAPILGPKVFNNIKKGLSLAENNPRIHYLIGVNYLFTPGFLGGGVDKGLEYLLKADSLYKEERSRTPEPLEPRWGYSTCLGFIGKAMIKKDNPQKAKTYFKTALNINPKDQLSITGLKEAEELIAKGN